jgi:phospholipid/cholesterol/gamma-HCH transport system substrate-binding protein
MDLHYKQEATVGGLVIVAIAVFIAGSMWLGGKSFTFKREALWRVRFTNVGKLQVGSIVKTSGVEVGKVRKIEYEGVDNVLVGFTLTPKIIPRADASATILESIAFSEATLVFKPGSPSEPPIDRSTIIRGIAQPDVFGRATTLADRADTLMMGLQTIANQKTADELHSTLRAMRRTMNLVSDKLPGTADEAKATLASLRKTSDRLDSLLANPALDRSISRLDTLTSNASNLTAQFTTTGARLDSVLSTVLRGQGTLGKMATDSGLYVDARGASQSLKALLDELQKNPGKIVVQVKIF